MAAQRRLNLYERSPEAQLVFDDLKRKVIGQDKVLSSIAERVAWFTDDLHSGDVPLASYLLLGPTGTGKTKTVEAVAECLHSDHKKLLKVNGGEYSHAHEVSRLTGSPPGFIGHRETDAILSQKRLDMCRPTKSSLAIVLFDEVDKMHPKVLDVLLSILDRGSLTLGNNDTVAFGNTIIFFTANFASRDFEIALTGNPFDIDRNHAVKMNLERLGIEKARKALTPEFFNRLTDVFVYNALTESDLNHIFTRELHEINVRMFSTKYDKPPYSLAAMRVTERAQAAIVKEGCDIRYGARNLRRIMDKRILSPWVQFLQRQELGRRCQVPLVIDAEGGKLVYIADEPAAMAKNAA